MLASLSIRNMLLVEKLDLEFNIGLNVLTGETGSGKSILLDCLGFVLGWKVRANLVRENCKYGEVSAEFQLSLSHELNVVLQEANIELDGSLIIRRIAYKDGRKKCYVNDTLCSVEFLRVISSSLIELHGQKDDNLLLRKKTHLKLLDDYAGLDGRHAMLKTAWLNWQNSIKDAEIARSNYEKEQTETDFFSFSIEEFAQLDPKPGEEAELEMNRRVIKANEKIIERLHKASGLFSESGVEKTLLEACQLLKEVEGLIEDQTLTEDIMNALDQSLDKVGDIKMKIDQVLYRFSSNYTDIESLEDRLFKIRELSRKHRRKSDDLPELMLQFSKKLDRINSFEKTIGDLEQKKGSAKSKYFELATSLSKLRQNAAHRLDNSMVNQLAPLKMEAARFKTKIVQTNKSNIDGIDEVDFEISTNPGSKFGPISKVASGGELSRILLALKVCLVTDTQGITLVFDEIDRGVGGATADAVGQRLSYLSKNEQILVVTHSPQVTAKANFHWHVTKEVGNDNFTRTFVKKLGSEDKKREIARMLSGKHITNEALAAAEKLLLDMRQDH